MYVYSGKCRLCDCGILLPVQDMYEKDLHTGDVVIMFTENEDGSFSYHGGMSVVVAKQYQTQQVYPTGYAHKLKEEELEFFVMGIKDVPFWTEQEWKVIKVKDHSDVIEGEHWKEFGFNYKST